MKNPQPNIEITKVTINISGKALELTIEQAKELQNILNTTFPNNKEYTTIKIIEKDYIPYPVFPNPNTPYNPYPLWVVDWSYNGSITYTLNNNNSDGEIVNYENRNISE